MSILRLIYLTFIYHIVHDMKIYATGFDNEFELYDSIVEAVNGIENGHLLN